MVSKLSLAVLALPLVSNGAIAAEPKAWSDVILYQSREPARDHRPGCNSDNKMTAGEVKLKVGAKLIDAFTGTTIATEIVNQAEQEHRNWLLVRLGLHAGGSTCATQCVIVPPGVNAVFSACIREHPAESHHVCYTEPSDYNGGGEPHFYARVENFTKDTTPGGKTIFCARGMNWSHNMNRVLRVQADW